MMATNTQNSHILPDPQQRRPIQLNDSADFVSTSDNRFDKLPPINSNISSNNESKSMDTKKIFKWRFWWEKNDSNIRIPIFESPSKLFENTQSRIASLEFINHKPGGGNVKVINEKPVWKKEAKTEHIARDYKPKGGQVKILNEKVQWNAQPKIGSLDFISHKPLGGSVKIVEQPFIKTGIKSKIDTGLILEELEVPYDYEINSPRATTRNTFRSSTQLHHLKEIKDSISKDLNTTRSSLKNH